MYSLKNKMLVIVGELIVNQSFIQIRLSKKYSYIGRFTNTLLVVIKKNKILMLIKNHSVARNVKGSFWVDDLKTLIIQLMK